MQRKVIYKKGTWEKFEGREIWRPQNYARHNQRLRSFRSTFNSDGIVDDNCSRNTRIS